MKSKNFVIIRDNENKTYVMPYTDKTDRDVFFSTISKHYAFSDCSGEDIVSIFWNGELVQYVGWQPNMRFEYQDLNDKTVWVGEFPQWDH